MIADIVVGLQHGDEAKGKVTHHLCKDGGYTHVLRFNGGGNAGHTIYHNGKKFVTHSDITFRYAFLHADRVRGISADMLLLDEIQDVLTEVIPVIEEALSHSPYKILRYSGTPKSLDNTISYYWNRFSTKNEWVVPCDGCNNWNVLGLKNIGKTGLICSKCGKAISTRHERAQWASMRSPEWIKNPPVSNPFEGYRIPQVMCPWVSWEDILDKRKRYTKAQFFNEARQAAIHKPAVVQEQPVVPRQEGFFSSKDAGGFGAAGGPAGICVQRLRRVAVAVGVEGEVLHRHGHVGVHF